MDLLRSGRDGEQTDVKSSPFSPRSIDHQALELDEKSPDQLSGHSVQYRSQGLQYTGHMRLFRLSITD